MINYDKLRKHKLVIATPMYGGNSTNVFTTSLVELFYRSGFNNLDVTFFTLWNDALVTRARNVLVKRFLKETNADIFLFIDSDIQFNYADVFYMMQMMIESNDKKIICGLYPKKKINWDFIHKAYSANRIINPEDATLYSAEFVLNYKNYDSNITFDLAEPLAVAESGTGFMMIHREVFEKFAETYPEQNSVVPDTGEDLFYYFDCKIDPETKYYLSEDYMFCQWASKIGYDTWVIPWINLNHMGTYLYKGSFSESAKLEYELMTEQGDDK